MREVSLPQSDQNMGLIVREAIERGESVTIVEKGKPVLDLVPRTSSWAQFRQMTAEQRMAAGIEIEKVRSNVRGKLTIQEITSSKHEGHRY